MTKTALLAGGGLLFVLGMIWGLQGLGVLGGSVMSGVTVWAIVGPILAVVGLVLILLGLRRAKVR